MLQHCLMFAASDLPVPFASSVLTNRKWPKAVFWSSALHRDFSAIDVLTDESLMNTILVTTFQPRQLTCRLRMSSNMPLVTTLQSRHFSLPVDTTFVSMQLRLFPIAGADPNCDNGYTTSPYPSLFLLPKGGTPPPLHRPIGFPPTPSY